MIKEQCTGKGRLLCGVDANINGDHVGALSRNEKGKTPQIEMFNLSERKHLFR